MKLTKDIVFNEDLLKKLPLTYHFMVELNREDSSELKDQKRFSASAKHQSSEYLNKATYKPISGILPE